LEILGEGFTERIGGSKEGRGGVDGRIELGEKSRGGSDKGRAKNDLSHQHKGGGKIKRHRALQEEG